MYFVDKICFVNNLSPSLTIQLCVGPNQIVHIIMYINENIIIIMYINKNIVIFAQTILYVFFLVPFAFHQPVSN